MNSETKQYKYVYSQKCAGYLMMRGYPLLKMERNIVYSNRNVYVFNYSSSIDDAIKEYNLNK